MDIETCLVSEQAWDMKALEVNFYELVKKVSYPFCGEIEVTHKNRPMQAYLKIIIPTEAYFPHKCSSHRKAKMKIDKKLFKVFDSLVKSYLYGLEEGNGLARSDNAQRGVVTA